MKTTTRLVALGVAGLLTAGLTSAVLVSSASASGARYNGSAVGTLSITPTAGTNHSAINYATSAPCPSGDSFYTLLFGAGMPDTGEVVTSKTSAGFSTSAPITSALQNTPQYYATKNNTTLSGTYDVVLRCTSGLTNTSLGDFRSTITFSSPTQYSSSGTAPSSSPSPSPRPSSSPAPALRHSTLSLSISKNRTGVRSYTFQGRVLPKLAGQAITLFRVDNRGREIRTLNLATNSAGIFRAGRTFSTAGTYSFLVRSAKTATYAAGKSNTVRITVK